MTTWIFGIDDANPQHWSFAKKHGFWDTTQRRPVARGDLIYFWQGGGSLLGLVRAASDTYGIPDGTWMPWNVDDDKRDGYRFRFDLDVVAEDAVGQPSWTELKRATGVKGHTGFGPRRVPAGGEAWLWAQTIGLDEAPAAGADPLFDVREELPGMSEDTRVHVQRQVAQRAGQASFRNRLMAAWQGRCIITGHQPARVLDAAHIQPYRGDAAHALGNGILLRADLHRLFDDHLITLVESEDGLIVRCAPALQGTSYWPFEGQVVQALPEDPNSRPHPHSLALHHESCAWLDGHEPGEATIG